MADRKFEFGDRVRHMRRPEWGIGSVVKSEEVSQNGEAAQRLSIRFPNAGLKTVSTAQAELELVTDKADSTGGSSDENSVADWHQLEDSKNAEWLAPIARRKVGESMIAIAADVRDPFSSLRRRLSMTLDLYRFGRTGSTLVDWAVAQSGLDDPLSRFTRHELELMFDQWASAREELLNKLLGEARAERAPIARLDRVTLRSLQSKHGCDGDEYAGTSRPASPIEVRAGAVSPAEDPS